MTKSTKRKAAAKNARRHRKIAPNAVPETARNTRREIAAKAAVEKSSDPRRKIAPRAAAETARDLHRKTSPKVFPETSRDKQREIATKTAAETARHSKIATQFDEFRAIQIPDSMPALAEKSVTHQFQESLAPHVPASMRELAQSNVDKTRELYERCANALKSILESWERSMDAAGQGAVAFNRKIIDIAERNISTGFDLARTLAGAKNLAEVIEVQAAYWRKQFGELKMQAEEIRALSKKVTADVAEPIKAQVTRDIAASTRRKRST